MFRTPQFGICVSTHQMLPHQIHAPNIWNLLLYTSNDRTFVLKANECMAHSLGSGHDNHEKSEKCEEMMKQSVVAIAHMHMHMQSTTQRKVKAEAETRSRSHTVEITNLYTRRKVITCQECEQHGRQLGFLFYNQASAMFKCSVYSR